jgi:GH15 family glucan-1,4-alpha-glucosidase
VLAGSRNDAGDNTAGHSGDHRCYSATASQEGTFSACSFWLVENLAFAGRVDESRLMLEKLLSYSNHVGLYAEEISPTGDALGNFPQAFTHLALITACFHLDRALNARKARVSTAPGALYD